MIKIKIEKKKNEREKRANEKRREQVKKREQIRKRKPHIKNGEIEDVQQHQL